MTDQCTVVTIQSASEVPVKPIDGKPTLVYWDVVGIAHPLRMALAYSGVEWCDVRMVCGNDPLDSQANKKEWFCAKKRLKAEGILEFPNLPYFLDTDDDDNNNQVSLVQTDAILRYLGHKFDLMGGAAPQAGGGAPSRHLMDMLLEEARDLDDTMVRLSYEQGGEAVAKWLGSQTLRDKLNVWNEEYIRKSDGSFVLGGNTLTLVDLRLYTFVFKFQHAQASLMASGMDTPALPFWCPAYTESVKAASPQLKAYLDCADMRIPINNPHAKFDNF